MRITTPRPEQYTKVWEFFHTNPARLSKGALARSTTHHPCRVNSTKAVKWDVYGAILRLYAKRAVPLLHALHAAIIEANIITDSKGTPHVVRDIGTWSDLLGPRRVVETLRLLKI